MYGCGKSDRPIDTEEAVEQRQARFLSAETVEGRGLAEGKTIQQNKFRTQGRMSGSNDRLAKCVGADTTSSTSG